MQINEAHHADVVLAFYRQLTDSFAGRGVGIFLKAANMYGENRGRRMALKALRDGHPLDFDSYFSYGELDSTPGECEYQMIAERGLVKENAVRCLWSRQFLARDGKDCANCYCKQIDNAVVRGYNPLLRIETLRNMHDEGSCVFLYMDGAITENTLNARERLLKPEQNEKRPMAFHTAEAYYMMKNTVEMVLGEQGVCLIARVRDALAAWRGQEFLSLLDSYADTDFSRI